MKSFFSKERLIFGLFILACIISIYTLTKGTFVFMTLLNGMAGSFLTAYFVLLGFRENTNSKKIENQLKLRELFSEERRWEVHRTIWTGNKAYWFKKAKEENNEFWEKSIAYREFYIPALNDYLGTFELAYMMIENEELTLDNFKASYFYRLDLLAKNQDARELIMSNKTLWKNLIFLFNLCGIDYQ